MAKLPSSLQLLLQETAGRQEITHSDRTHSYHVPAQQLCALASLALVGPAHGQAPIISATSPAGNRWSPRNHSLRSDPFLSRSSPATLRAGQSCPCRARAWPSSHHLCNFSCRKPLVAKKSLTPIGPIPITFQPSNFARWPVLPL